MRAHYAWRAAVLGVVVASSPSAAAPGSALSLDVNYESLYSMEEPLAIWIGDVTLTFAGLPDVRLSRETEGTDDTSLLENDWNSAAMQLPNRWRVDHSYIGQRASDPTSVFGSGKGFTDNRARSVGSYWGSVMAGNVSGVVHEQARLLRGAGNASLAFDDGLGALAEEGAGYTGRFGPWVVGLVIERDGRPNLSAMFQRPSGNMDWRLTLRAFADNYTASDDSARFDTTAFGVVREPIYGNATSDAGFGCERFSSRRSDAERRFLSTGVRTKKGVLTLSLEGHLDEIDGKEEVSSALGPQFDLARERSASLGIYQARAAATSTPRRGNSGRTHLPGARGGDRRRYAICRHRVHHDPVLCALRLLTAGHPHSER